MKHYYVVTTEKIKTILEHPAEQFDNPDHPLYCWSLDNFNTENEALLYKANHPQKDHLLIQEREKSY